jgi:predicted DNA-binding transcriptional regulator AlpA
MTHFHHAAIVSALLASVGAVNAQTTVITHEPVESRTVVTTEPLQLTPVQRQTIYRTIVRERVPPARPSGEYRVGARLPESVQLYTLPHEVEVPAIRAYKYMVVNNRVVLIDPATSEVVAEVVD